MDWTKRWDEFRQGAADCLNHLQPDELDYASNISLQHRYIYVETAKVGCSTIKKLLIKAEYGDLVDAKAADHVHFRDFSPLLNAKQVGDFREFVHREDIFSFCFVRNPYSRLLSAYLDKIAKQKPEHQELMIQLGYGPFSEKILSFEEFVNAVIDQPVLTMNTHWRTQYYATFQHGITYDFIGRFESFEQDLRIAMDRIGIDMDTYYQVQAGHATHASQKLDAYYTPDLAEKVYRKYLIDFEHFSYPKELPG
ncbi:MAG: sulfotransferase family protein [Bacteroidota bacterium]